MLITPGPAARIDPVAGPAFYKTYRVVAPLKTHWRAATCAETGCAAWLQGWTTTLDERTGPGQYHAATIAGLRPRYKFTRTRLPSGLTEYAFEAGQACFEASKHYVRVARPDKFLVVGGDWRGNPRNERRVHANGLDWAEDCAEHCDRINTALERG